MSWAARGIRLWNDSARWRRWLVWVAGVILLWPFVATLAYRFVPVPVSNLMLLHLGNGAGISKNWVPLSAMAPALPRAIIAAEDERFCAHHGIDWVEFGQATAHGFGHAGRGASTLTMQLAKNLYLWEGHSVVRKGIELPLAAYMDLVLPKRREMEIYLNVAEWGPGIYGAEAAARYHFGKSAATLNSREAALLAASLPNPIKRVAGKPSREVRAVAARIGLRMRHMGPYVSCILENPKL